jgi:hypothetical protein
MRPLLLVAVGGLAMLCTACGASNNKGKIEGKWKITDMPHKDDKSKKEFEDMTKMGLYVYFDFKPDNALEMGVGADKPEVLEFIKALSKGEPLQWNAKYKLLSGDGVEFYDLPKEMREKGGGLFGGNKDRARTNIKIEGDKMTMTDADGKTGQLTKIK